MMDRIIFLGTAINDQVANIVQAQLLFWSRPIQKTFNIFEFARWFVYWVGIYDDAGGQTRCRHHLHRIAASMAAVLLGRERPANGRHCSTVGL